MLVSKMLKVPSPGSLPVALLLAGGILTLSCSGGDEIPNRPIGTPPPPATRPSDGLLSDPALQEIVDLQVRRDGGGLRAFLSSPEARVRARAAFALASVQDPEAAPDLTRLLRDPDPAVRRDAAFAIGQLGDPVHGPVLLGAFQDEEAPEVRARLLEAIGKVGDERSLERLMRVGLEPGEEGARNLAISRIGIRGVTLPSSVSFLLEELRSSNEEARNAAGYFFGRNPTPAPWLDRADGVRGVLDSLPPSNPVAMQLLLGLALTGDSRDIPRFLWWMKSSSDWRIRTNAARATGGWASDSRVRPSLMEALGDPSTHVAVSASSALANAKQLTPGEVERLKEWVDAHPRDWRTGGPILTLLGRLGEGAFIMDWLDRQPEDDIAARTRGLGAIAFVPGDEATQVLLYAANSPVSRIRGTAIGGLARRWRVEREDPSKADLYYQAFADGLRTGDPAASYVAAPALADSAFFPLGSIGLLTEEYGKLTLPEGLEGMQAILRALGETGSEEAEALLVREASAENGAIRAVARDALAALRGEELPDVAEAAPPDRVVQWEALARLGARPRLVLETNKGVVVVEMDTESAPLTVQTVAGFAAEGRYDGVRFHRVVPNFVVQGGDFQRQDGFGGPGFAIRSEFTQVPFARGVLGMASAGKDTEGSQFFVTHSVQPHLDGGYTAFGWVVEGMDVVDVIYEDDLIVTARVEPDPA